MGEDETHGALISLALGYTRLYSQAFIETLLEGADVNAQDRPGDVPLLLAAFRTRGPAFVELLIAAGLCHL